MPRDFEKAVDAAIGHLTRYPKSVQDEALGAAELSPKERPPSNNAARCRYVRQELERAVRYESGELERALQLL